MGVKPSQKIGKKIKILVTNISIQGCSAKPRQYSLALSAAKNKKPAG